ncbi:hypothetical protein OSCI_4010011 [Kamptonema sp. PCC 6506]|nr:hypothetical protein OSCI_4010011 [Kamptonema sp. PCC 6506]
MTLPDLNHSGILKEKFWGINLQKLDNRYFFINLSKIYLRM